MFDWRGFQRYTAAVAGVKPTAPPRGPHAETLLQQYLDANGIASARVEAKLRERLHDRTPSRHQFSRWRLGRVDIRRKDMVRILWAVREVSANVGVRIEELFDVDPRTTRTGLTTERGVIVSMLLFCGVDAMRMGG